MRVGFKAFVLSVALAVAGTSLAVADSEQTAIARMEEMAEALTQCATDTGYYVSLEALNDTSSSSASPAWDYINANGGTYVIEPGAGLFLPQCLNLTAGGAWKGPYVTYGVTKVQTTETYPYDQGSPLDPWGNPYRLFTPLGLARGENGLITMEQFGDSFDRYTIVSFGPDGVLGGGDDLFHQFGEPLSQKAISSIYGDQVSAILETPTLLAPATGALFHCFSGTRFVCRGYNLGDLQGTSHVYLGGGVLATVTDWNATSFVMDLSPELSGAGLLHVSDGSQATNNLRLEIIARKNSVNDWACYP